jgi:hypothetical protein
MKRLLRLALVSLVFAAGSTAPDAAILQFGGTLTGTAEVPPSGSPGTGTVLVTYDTVSQMLNVNEVFSGLIWPTTLSHIHCCTPPGSNAGISTPLPSFPGFPTGVTSGSYNMTFDLSQASSFNPAFVTAQGSLDNARNALLAGMSNSNAYLNIHTQQFPGGEIRALLSPVPEPATWAMMILGFGMVGVGLRRRRRAQATA